MKSIWRALAAAAAISTAVQARPLNVPARFRRGTEVITDQIVLNFALTLEHLENAYYTKAMALFDEAAFVSAGLPVWARGRFNQISQNEAFHVKYLTTALGANATAACTYDFGGALADPVAFATMSEVFEGVGASAYTGAANLLQDPTFVTQAAAILSTEARQAGWVASAVNKQNAWSTSLETPLDFNQAFSLATGFIVSCPSTNPVLPISAFPALNITGTIATGETLTLGFAVPKGSGPLFLALLTGLTTEFAPIKVSATGGSVVLPDALQGTVYAMVTSSNATANDADTVAGVGVLHIVENSAANILF